jgi:hypothetical protein
MNKEVEKVRARCELIKTLFEFFIAGTIAFAVSSVGTNDLDTLGNIASMTTMFGAFAFVTLVIYGINYFILIKRIDES